MFSFFCFVFGFNSIINNNIIEYIHCLKVTLIINNKIEYIHKTNSRSNTKNTNNTKYKL